MHIHLRIRSVPSRAPFIACASERAHAARMHDGHDSRGCASSSKRSFAACLLCPFGVSSCIQRCALLYKAARSLAIALRGLFFDDKILLFFTRHASGFNWLHRVRNELIPVDLIFPNDLTRRLPVISNPIAERKLSPGRTIVFSSALFLCKKGKTQNREDTLVYCYVWY